MDHRVYVMLGFHINFYHSWRGDTPDEAGFGTDMRVMRGVLDMLDNANVAGKQARAYWDTEVYWTFQEILPKYCPDILERMRTRVSAGQDEIALGPFNNGANHAATADEFRAAVAWAIENPWGSGLRQLFPEVTPFYRPQESMFTTGQEQILKEYGVTGLMLYYALVPFNALGVFTPALSLERRYNPFWFRSREDQPRLVVFPAMSAADVLEMSSLETMLLDLHARQQSGEICSDVVIHLNEDADLESWLPIRMPPGLGWFPNTGGLDEYIRAVNKYPWADFTVPGEYLASHPPQGEVLVRQDLADGGFDGSYSWAEKCASLRTWTLLEQARLASYRAETLARYSDLDLRELLWEGMESAFFQRLIGLSTTHFGMSTPVINEERQARAFAILGKSRQRAQEAERKAASLLACNPDRETGTLYDFELFLTPPGRNLEAAPAHCAVRVPVILPAGVQAVKLEREGRTVPCGLTEMTVLPDGSTFCEARFTAYLQAGTRQHYRIAPADEAAAARSLTHLQNEWLRVEFCEQTGIRSFKQGGVEIGGQDFLQPFVSYRSGRKPMVHPAGSWQFLPLTGEHWDGLQRVRMRTLLPMKTLHGEFTSDFTYTFTLFDDLPQLFVDVEAKYAATPSTETIQNMIQKLRRLMDLHWIEVAPFQLHPALKSPLMRVWKHNYLGITAFYDLNYGQINRHNRNLDSFNHQVTAGWVAVTDGKRGLLLGENAEQLASMAFCPMRLREKNGVQHLWLNPFGSYYGKQADYGHLGANGLGADFLKAFSGFLRPNGPSYNGQTVRFGLMLAPYEGSEPSKELQAQADAYFYPPGLVYHAVPQGLKALLPGDIRAHAESELRMVAIEAVRQVPTPAAFLANPSHGQVDLVWEAPRDVPVTGYELAWRSSEAEDWHAETIPAVIRWQVDGLESGREHLFKLRAVCGKIFSNWTAEAACTPGAVTESGVGGGFALLPPSALIRLLAGSLWSVIRSVVRR